MVKYRMFIENGYIETLDFDEAKSHGNYKVINAFTIIDKNTGQELRCQFHDEIAENEMLIDTLRTEPMDNPYWDFEKKQFYNKI